MNDYADPELERLKAAAADRERKADACEVAAGIVRETGFGWMRSDLRFAVGDRMAAAVERCAECDGVAAPAALAVPYAGTNAA